MKTTLSKSWSAIAQGLGVSTNTLRAWRSEKDAPSEKNLADWQAYVSETKSGDGRVVIDGETFTADQIRALKARLTQEQGRHAAAMADLRELELKMKSENLVPESAAREAVGKVLIPLRSLLDGFPRVCAAMANPENPMVAEIGIRKMLDDRVFAEIQRILKSDQCQTDET